MGLIKCKECGKEISDQAAACPHCGAKPSIDTSRISALFVSAAILLFVIIILSQCNTSSVPAAAGKKIDSAPLAVTPHPAPPLPTENEKKARASVDKIKDDVFCLTMGKILRKKGKQDKDYLQAIYQRAMDRENVTDPMFVGIEAHAPVIGMNVCALLAALGRPDRSNHSKGAFGDHYQLIYENPKRYVYVENWVVTSWQD